MANISSLGVGTGIDLNSILSKLVEVESIPLQQLQSRQTSYESKLSAIGRVQSAVDKLTTAATKFASTTAFKGFTATVADTTIASATATSYAAEGSYALRVNRLAQANKLLSSPSPSIAAGTLQIELGDISSGSFVAKSGTSPITVNFTGSTIQDLRNAINDAQAGVTASIINGDAGPQLLISSNETGQTNTIKLTGSGGLSGLTYDPITPSASFTEKSEAQDASIELEGAEILSSTNTFEDAITGVTIKVTKANDPLDLTDATTLTVGSDNDGMSSKLNDFVTAWNELNSLTKTLTKYDVAKKTAAVLTGDGSVTSIQSQLRTTLFSTPSGIGSIYTNLADLGVSLQSDGTLKLDSSKFSTALGNNLADASATISAFGAAFESASKAFTDTSGIITARQDSLNATIKAMTARQTELQRHIDAVQARYQKQFTALDKLMGQLQTQSSYLSQQLAQLG